MKRLPTTLLTLTFTFFACSNQQPTESIEQHDTTQVEETQKQIVVEAEKKPTYKETDTNFIHHAPLKYGCNIPSPINKKHISETNFTDKALEGMLYGGELRFKEQCADHRYFLFFGVGDIHWPFIDVRSNGQSDTLIHLFHTGCSDMDGLAEESFTLDTNGIVKIFTHTNYINQEETFDTAIIDLKQWCD